jgi:predicted aconitase
LNLTDDEKKMRDGQRGEAVGLAMSILVDICCALTGRAPKTGLYLDENRMAAIHAMVEDFPVEAYADARFYPLLGYFIGKQCGNQVVAISGIPRGATKENLKGLGAATSSSGATALFHIVGITPEAPTLAACLKNDTTIQTIVVTPDALKKTEALLCTAENEQLDWVGFGCPHFSYAEFTDLAECIAGKKINSDIAFSVFTSRKILVFGVWSTRCWWPVLSSASIFTAQQSRWSH